MNLNSLTRSYSSKILKIKKKKTRKKNRLFERNTIKLLRYNLSFFKKLENYKLTKENHFTLNFFNNTRTFSEIYIKCLQDFFLLKVLRLLDNVNSSITPSSKFQNSNSEVIVAGSCQNRPNNFFLVNTQNTSNGSYTLFPKKELYRSNSLLHVSNWYTILLHNHYTYRSTPGRTLGVLQTLKSHFLANKVFVATSVYPYGFKMVLNYESSMLNNFIVESATFKNLNLTGFSAAILNCLSSSDKINFLRKYGLRDQNSLGVVNRDKMFIPILKVKTNKLRKLRGVRLSIRQIRRKFRKIRRKIRRLIWTRKKKYFLRKLRRLFRRKKRHLRKWKMRLNRSKFAIKIYKNKAVKLKVRRLLPLNKSGMSNFFTFIKHYNLWSYTKSTSSGSTTYNTNPVDLKKFNFFNKNLISFFMNFKNSFFLKNTFFKSDLAIVNKLFGYSLQKRHLGNKSINLDLINLQPNFSFNLVNIKYLWLTKANMVFKENLTPWVYTNLVQFIEFCSGRRVVIHLYSFMNQSMDIDYITLYKRWIPRLFYYERKLGHRFFLEEALHILHMSFSYRDAKFLGSWLGAIIKRISFWKTRFIFRFIKYLFNNYFSFILNQIGVKGFKVKLKGKISVAGNSRKRTILYRVGQTSHASCNLRVVHHFSTIVTFTGVQGFQVWIFY